ncbi:MAG TPA: hypothetical protein VEY95_14160 [Azospirillaceae bacterium]|nr:hypothetical protein [Azospirillaceae bacterium]
MPMVANLHPDNESANYTRTIGRELAVTPLTNEEIDHVSGGHLVMCQIEDWRNDHHSTICGDGDGEYDDCD